MTASEARAAAAPVQQNATLEPAQLAAAALVAVDERTDAAIARSAGVDRSTLWRWKQQPAFMAEVARAREAFRRRVLSRQFADKHRRVIALNQSARKLHKHLEASDYEATRYTAEGQEYRVFDKERYKEFRETLEQIAVEVGDRKRDGGVNVGVGVAVKVYTEPAMANIFDVEAWRDDRDPG
jgi:hypothetical protein